MTAGVLIGVTVFAAALYGAFSLGRWAERRAIERINNLNPQNQWFM